MSPADTQAVTRITADIRDLSDRDLANKAAEYACLPGDNAAAVRHAVDAEQEYRRAVRRAYAAGGAR